VAKHVFETKILFVLSLAYQTRVILNSHRDRLIFWQIPSPTPIFHKHMSSSCRYEICRHAYSFHALRLKTVSWYRSKSFRNFLCPVWADRLKIFCLRCGKFLWLVSLELLIYRQTCWGFIFTTSTHFVQWCSIHSRLKNSKPYTVPVSLGHAELCSNNNENSHLEEFYYSERYLFDYRS